MPTVVNVPDLGRVRFPDGMGDDEIVAAIAKLRGGSEPTKVPPNPETQAVSPESTALQREMVSGDVPPRSSEERAMRDFEATKAAGLTTDAVPVGNDLLTRPLINLPAVSKELVELSAMTEGFPINRDAAEVIAGGINVAGRGVSALTSPVGIATLALAPLGAPVALSRVVSGAFGVQMAHDVVGPMMERAGTASVLGSLQEKVEAYGDPLLTSLFVFGATKHADPIKAVKEARAALKPSEITPQREAALNQLEADATKPPVVLALENAALPETARALDEVAPDVTPPESTPKAVEPSVQASTETGIPVTETLAPEVPQGTGEVAPPVQDSLTTETPADQQASTETRVNETPANIDQSGGAEKAAVPPDKIPEPTAAKSETTIPNSEQVAPADAAQPSLEAAKTPDELAAQGDPIAKQIARGYNALPLDEALGAANTGLDSAVKTFDPSKGDFQDHVTTYVYNALHDALRKSNAAKRGGGVEKVSLQSDLPGDTGQQRAEMVADESMAGPSTQAQVGEISQKLQDAIARLPVEHQRTIRDFLESGRGRLNESAKKALRRLIKDEGLTREDLEISRGPGAASPSDVGNQVERKFSERFNKSQDIESQTRARTGNRFYDQRSNEETNWMVNHRIERQGIDQVYQDIMEDNPDLPPEEQVVGTMNITMRLNAAAKALEKAGKSAEANLIRDRIANLIEKVSEREGTGGGRGVQAFATWARMGPEGMLRAFNRAASNARKKLGAKTRDVIERARDAVNQINDEVAGEVSKSPAAKKARKQSERTAEKAKAVESVWQQYRESAAEKVIDSLSESKIQKSPPLQEFTARLQRELIKLLAPKEKARIAKLGPFEVVAEILRNQEKYRDVIDTAREQIKERYAEEPEKLAFLDEVLSSALEKPFSSKTVDNLARTIIRDAGFNLESMVRAGADVEAARAEISRIFRGLGKPYEVIHEDLVAAADRLIEEARANAAKPRTERTAKRVEGQEPAVERPEPSLWEQYQERIASSVVKALEARQSGPKPMLDEFANRVRAAIQENIPPGEKALPTNPREVLMEALKNPEKFREAIQSARDAIAREFWTLDRDKVDALDQALGPLVDTPFSRRAFAEVAGEETNIDQLIRDHFTKQDAAGTDLAQKLVREAGLSEPEAARVAKALQEEFKRLTDSKKRKAIDQIIASSQRSKGKRVLKTQAQQLIEASNLGALSEDAAYNALADKLGLPKLDPAVRREILRRADELQLKPEGFQRDKATSDLLAYMLKQRGIPGQDVFWSWYYASILSSPVTQAINMTGGIANVVANFGIQSILHPTAVSGMLTSLARGVVSGSAEAKAVLREGDFTGKSGVVKHTPVFEILKDSDSRFLRALSNARFVGRAIVAADMLNFRAAQEMKAFLLAREIGVQEGLRGIELNRRVSEILGRTEEAREAAEAQADAEGLTGYQNDRRVEEVIRQSRPVDLDQGSASYALETTYSNKPYGVLGVFSDGIEGMSRKFAPIKFVVPFTRIVSNVTNTSINYTPWGFKRAFFGHFDESKWFDREQNGPVGEAAKEQYAKAIAGSAAMIGLLVVTLKYKDDKDPPIQITARGPANTGHRYQWQESGGKQYAVKIGNVWLSYHDTPLNIPLAMIGNISDAIRYNKFEEKDVLTRFAYAFKSAGGTVMDQSFLKGASDLAQALTDKNSSGQTLLKSVARSGSSVVVPNAVKWVDRIFDPELKDAQNLSEYFAKEAPVARSTTLKPLLNVLGEPVKKEGFERIGLDRFVGFGKSDPVWKMIVEKDAYISTPDKNTKIGDRTMEPDEYYDYVRISGKAIRERVQEDLAEFQSSTMEAAQTRMKAIVDAEREMAKIEIARRARDAGTLLKPAPKK